jgi:hypothetical protein
LSGELTRTKRGRDVLKPITKVLRTGFVALMRENAGEEDSKRGPEGRRGEERRKSQTDRAAAKRVATGADHHRPSRIN